ncbi:MAG TPA: Na+/H+ antiporter subunit E [Myxococcaceae bacterium]|nr:Na+/H+ antiporter subunit E [Myxococcaceae bacterium]
MSTFLWNVVLAFLWAAVLGEISLSNLAIGFLLGLVVLGFAVPGGVSPYALKVVYMGRLLALVVWEVLTANLRIAQDILTPRPRARPAIYAYEMEARTDAEVTLLALLVTFTPGTLGLEVSEDQRLLYVHVMFPTTREEFRRRLSARLERPLLQVMR